MGTKRLLYIFLPPDGTHHSDWQEATLLFLKLSCFLLCWTQTHQRDWYILLLYKEHLVAPSCSIVYHYRGWPVPFPTKTSPRLPPHRHRNYNILILRGGGESTVLSTKGILWLTEFFGQLKPNLCVSSYLHSLTSSAWYTNICYMTCDLQGSGTIFPNVKSHWVVLDHK